MVYPFPGVLECPDIFRRPSATVKIRMCRVGSVAARDELDGPAAALS
jgi:hypothetical protein